MDRLAHREEKGPCQQLSSCFVHCGGSGVGCTPSLSVVSHPRQSSNQQPTTNKAVSSHFPIINQPSGSIIHPSLISVHVASILGEQSTAGVLLQLGLLLVAAGEIDDCYICMGDVTSLRPSSSTSSLVYQSSTGSNPMPSEMLNRCGISHRESCLRLMMKLINILCRVYVVAIAT